MARALPAPHEGYVEQGPDQAALLQLKSCALAWVALVPLPQHEQYAVVFLGQVISFLRS